MSLPMNNAADVILKARVEALMADYMHAIDSDRLEDWPGFFAEDAVYRVVTRENVEQNLPLSLIYCRGRGMFRDRISALRTANIYEPHVYCHHFSALRLMATGAGVVDVESNFSIIRTMADGAMSVFVCGRAIDRIVETEDGLKFGERKLILDSKQVDTLLVLPL